MQLKNNACDLPRITLSPPSPGFLCAGHSEGLILTMQHTFHIISHNFIQPRRFLCFRHISGHHTTKHTMQLHLFFSLIPTTMEESPRHSPCTSYGTLLVTPILLCPGWRSLHQGCLGKQNCFFLLHFDEHLPQGAASCLWVLPIWPGRISLMWNDSSYNVIVVFNLLFISKDSESSNSCRDLCSANGRH